MLLKQKLEGTYWTSGVVLEPLMIKRFFGFSCTFAARFSKNLAIQKITQENEIAYSCNRCITNIIFWLIVVCDKSKSARCKLRGFVSVLKA